MCCWVAVLCLCFIVGQSKNKTNKTQRVSSPFKKAWPLLLLLGFSVAWQAYQGFYDSVSAYKSQQSFLLGLSYLGIFSLSLLLIDSKKRMRQTAALLVGSALFQALFGSFMVLSGVEYLLLVPKDSYLGLVTGTFVNRNSMSAYLVMCVSIGIGLMLSTLADKPANSWREHMRRWMSAVLSRKIILRLSLVMIVAGLVMTHSRMGNSSFFISLLIMAPLTLILTRLNKKTRSHGKSRSSLMGMLVLLASLVVIDVAVVGTFFGVEEVAKRLEATSQKTETRDDVVTSAMPLLKKVYITGTGAGSFYTAFPEYRTYEVGSIFYDLAHNDYLQFLVEFGLIGSLPLLLLCLIVFITAIRSQLQRGDKLLRGMGFGASMSIMALGIHSTVDFNLQMPANAATSMVVLALGWLSFCLPGSRQRSQE